MPICATSIQLRRCPSNLVRPGSRIRSTTGAQNTFTEYVIPIQLKNPMVERLTPYSVNQAERVENTSRKGRPAEKPRKAIASTLGWAYMRSDSRHVGLGCVSVFRAIDGPLVAEVVELQRNLDVCFLKRRHHLLQIISLLTGNPHFLAVDLRLQLES